MIGQVLVAWLALNYAFAAQLVYMAARRADVAPMAALWIAMLWPLEMVRPVPVSLREPSA